MSLRARLAGGLAIILAVALSGLGVAIVNTTRTQLMSDTRELVERALFNRVNAGEPPVDAPPAPRDPRGLATAHLIIDPDDSTSAAEPAGPPSAPLPPPAPTTAEIESLRRGDEVISSSSDGSIDYLLVAEVLADGRMEVEGAPLNDVDANVSALALRFTIGGVVTLLLAIGSIMLFVRRGLRPLDRIVATADAVAAGAIEARPPLDEGPEEIRRLAGSIDTMLTHQANLIDSQAATEQRLRRFISDASHELQTPVTSILGWTQLQRRGALTPDESEAAARRIESEARRLASLVDDMLLLARLDERRSGVRQRVDLADIAHDAVLDAGAIDATRPVKLRATPTFVVGDPDRLRQVLDNLLRNVRTHTPAGTVTDVVVHADGTGATVQVADDGPGIAAEHLPHVFDRFWRADGSTSGRAPGSGLGLAIVDAIVRSHGGTVTATNRPAGGASFTVTIPIESTADARPD